MQKDQTPKETPEQIIRDVCGAGVFKKEKKKRLRNLTETDIDIFAGE